MKTKAVRLYGIDDLRLEEFDLPAIEDDEILAKVVSDSICMSSHKLAMQGDKHKRVRAPLASNPVIVGHEFCGELVEVGKKWRGRFAPGQKFAIQPALNYQGSLWAPGYSYPHIGGDATYVVIPAEVMESGCLLEYEAEAFFMGSLSEPMSCIVGAYHAQYHTRGGSYVHEMGIKEGGSLALLASVGPMGMGAIDYAMHAPRRPARVVVTDIDEARLARAASIFTVEEAARNGVELRYVNTRDLPDPVARLRGLNGGKLFDDVFVFAPVRPVVELGDRLLGPDGCLNFFAGPTDTSFSASLNFYDVHYESHHLVGTSGGNTDDIVESLAMMAAGTLNPVAMITHVGGLDAVADTTIRLDKIPGGKKLIYTHKRLPLVALADLEEKGRGDPLLAELARAVKSHNGLWSKEAEDLVLAKAPAI
ncbi:MAG TPA: zinc-binding dehydrogenase [Spirochaetales bacterium]|nr:zinc-binding dehydrogenase [Spirochaetales bacterium]HRY54874.1 zinc-binding dehydrogenase [Spirochaetia bacterium]HRZ63606.1 zinc-binding dehydrogenase [Spirochaetia bacterium]